MGNNDKSQLELFTADILDVAPKGDMLITEHPIFSLSKRRDIRKWVYQWRLHPGTSSAGM